MGRHRQDECHLAMGRWGFHGCPLLARAVTRHRRACWRPDPGDACHLYKEPRLTEDNIQGLLHSSGALPPWAAQPALGMPRSHYCCVVELLDSHGGGGGGSAGGGGGGGGGLQLQQEPLLLPLRPHAASGGSAATSCESAAAAAASAGSPPAATATATTAATAAAAASIPLFVPLLLDLSGMGPNEEAECGCGEAVWTEVPAARGVAAPNTMAAVAAAPAGAAGLRGALVSSFGCGLWSRQGGTGKRIHTGMHV